MQGFYRIAAAAPRLHLGDPAANAKELVRLAKDAAKDAKEKKGKDEESQKIARQLKQDNQLRMALQIVKGLPRMQSIKN